MLFNFGLNEKNIMSMTPDGIGLFVTNPQAALHIAQNTTVGLNGLLVTNPWRQPVTGNGTFFGLGEYFFPQGISDDDAVIWNYQNTNMYFGTGNYTRMMIDAAGRVAIAGGQMPSAVLNIGNNSQGGVLFPRYNLGSTTDNSTVPTPAFSLFVFNNNSMMTNGHGMGYYYNYGSSNSPSWYKLLDAGDLGNLGDWSLTGNTGNSDAINFIGNIDNVPLNFRVNNVASGRIEGSGMNNNTFMGYVSGLQQVGQNNTGFGFETLSYGNTGTDNTAVGTFAMQTNTGGKFNVAVGSSALQNSSSNTTGNVGLGYYALQVSSGAYNVGIGYQTGYSNTTGYNNTAVGSLAAINNTTGFENSAFGFYALGYNRDGVQNTAIGRDALHSNISGNGLTGLGYGADVSADGLFNATAIGYSAIAGTSNSLVLGGTGVYQVNVGIGTTTPADMLDVEGYIRAKGYRTRTGTGGSFGSNMFNVNWTGSAAQLYIDNVNVGTITLTSDRRLKDNITAQTDNAITRVRALNPVKFHYKNIDGTIFTGNSLEQEGFIADELQQIIPSAVNGQKDAVTADGKIQPQTLNLAPVVSVLTKAVQEQQTTIDEQKTWISKMQQQIDELKKEVQGIKNK